MAERESFIFYRSFFKLSTLLNNESYRLFVDSICEFALNGKVIDFGNDKQAKILFESILPQLQANQKRYEGGLKGGNPNFKKGQTNPYYAPKDNQEITKEITKNITKTLPNENDNVNDNVNVNDNKEKNIKNIKKEKSAQFIKPTLEEVQSYCKERNNNIDAEQFIDYYQSIGWKVGNKTMKDWKACIRTWEKNKTNRQQGKVNNKGEDLIEEMNRIINICGDN